MKTSDEQILERLWRRISRPRGTVFIEFAAMAPIAIMLICFAFDFSRILRCEQQLEIAARAMCELETHWMKTSYDGQKGNGTEAFPRSESKKMVKKYLAKAMDMTSNDAGYFYCKAELAPVPGLTGIIGKVADFLNGNPSEQIPWVLGIISKVIGKLLDIFTMKTQRYFTEVVPRDQWLRVSFGAQLPTLLPRGVYDVMGWTAASGKGKRVASIQQSAYELTPGFGPKKAQLNKAVRKRVWCVMPVMDSAVLPPKTYGRQIKGFINRYIPKWLQVILF